MQARTFREKTGRDDRLIKTAILTIGIAFVAVHGFVYWRYGEIGLDPLVVALIALSGALCLPSLFGRDGRVPRRLTLAENGLTVARGRVSRHWRWEELTAAEIQGHGARSEACVRMRVRGVIDWKARWTLMPSTSRMEFRIPTVFDAPPREICKALNDYRDRALAASVAIKPA